MSFVHLHVHTEHSFLDGVSTLPGLVQRVTDLGQSAVAITDHGEVSGHVKFQQAALAKDIQPIFGMEGYFVDDVAERIAYNYKHITLLAVSQVGLTNLWKLSSLAYTEGLHYKPRIDWKMLQAHGEGIVGTGGCLGGCVASYLIEGEDQYNPDFADERIGRFMDVLDGRFYLEVHTFPDDKQRQVNKAVADKAGMFGVPLLAVSDSHYLQPDDWEMHELLIAAGMQKKAKDPTRFQYGPAALHVMGEEEVYEKLTGHLPAEIVRLAMDNTVDIAAMAEGIKVEGNRTFPIFLDTTDSDVDLLTRDAWRLFEDRIDKLKLDDKRREVYRDRLTSELDLIISKGYAGYFLITADIVRWSKANGMLVGPGRGSAGGSLLSYVLGITELDPVEHGLLFERFLDPNLKSLPDIDIDVPQLERQAVLKRLRELYKPGCVAGIGTLMTLKPKVLMNDFCRVLDISRQDNAAMSRIISATKDLDKDSLTWPEVYALNFKEFKPWKDRYSKLFELLNAFAAHYRQAGAHAAALVVNREPLLGKLPLRIKNREDREVRTQFPMEDVEELGYMKMDFLGIRTLSTLTRAWWMANGGDQELLPKWDDKRGDWFGGKDHFDAYVDEFDRLKEHGSLAHFYDWQYDNEKFYGDVEAYKSIWDGKNLGVFQIETEGVSGVTKRYLPQSLEDMCAIVSLYRPGITRAIDPDTNLNLLELGLQKREGRVRVSYHHPLLEPILSNSYGGFLYQEQIMQVVRDLGDFSPEDQTKVRKALGKKLGLEKYKETFITNSVGKGIESEVAETIWNDMEKFGEYGFNKSHGFAYGLIAYWCVYMKHHFPNEFLTALFQTNNDEKKAYNRECRRLDIPLLGPDINESRADFALVNGRIRYGFQGTRNVGDKASVSIQLHGPYSSATDVMDKLLAGPDQDEAKLRSKATKRTVESLILVGALDSIVTDEDRVGLPTTWSNSKVALYRMFRKKLKIGVRKDAGLDEAGIFMKYLPEFKAYADDIKVDDLDLHEPVYLGEHVTTMPFGKYLDTITEHYHFRGYEEMGAGEHAIIGGNVGEVIERKVQKEGPNKNRAMGWVMLEFPIIEEGRIVDIEARKLVCFPKEYTYLADKLMAGVPIIAKVEKLADSNGYEGGLCLQSVYRMDKGEYPGMHHVKAGAALGHPTAQEGYWD